MSDRTHEHRVAAGYKATISNPNTSQDAKDHARRWLNEHGDNYNAEKKSDSAPVERTGGHDDTLSGNAIGGYKATISNPRTSEAAKDKARAILGVANPNDFASDAHSNRVLGGYKATIHNPNTSQEAKERAHELLREHNQDVE